MYFITFTILISFIWNKQVERNEEISRKKLIIQMTKTRLKILIKNISDELAVLKFIYKKNFFDFGILTLIS